MSTRTPRPPIDVMTWPSALAGPPAAPDDRTEVLGVDAHLQPLATPGVDHPDPDLVRMVDDALDEVLQRRPERAVRLVYRRRHRRSPRSERAPRCGRAPRSG